MKFGFVTCVQLGLACIEEIYALDGQLDLLVCLEDDQARAKSGRIYLDEFAATHQVPLVKSRHVSDDKITAAILDHELDWLFIIGWSQIARATTLDAPKRGCLGMHPTLLPQGRGRAAIPWAILKGLEKTGVTMFKLDEGVDTGPIVAQEEIPLTDTTSADELYQAVDATHRLLMRRSWPALANDTVTLNPQNDDLATEWPGRRPEDGEIGAAPTLQEVDRLVRAVTHPYPGAYRQISASERMVIWSGSPTEPASHAPIQCVDGQYWPHEIEWQRA